MTRSGRDALRARARLRGLLLILAPDGRCAVCKRKRPLEVDHVDGCTWSRRSLNRWARVNRYVREFRSGVRLRALCRSCNGSDGAKKQAQRKLADVVLFHERPESIAYEVETHKVAGMFGLDETGRYSRELKAD